MNYLNLILLMLMIQLPFTEENNLEVPKVKSVIAPVCEWKPAATNIEITFFKLPAVTSDFKPGDYVRRAKNGNSENSGYGTSIVVSRYGGKVIVNFPVDGEGNVIVSFLKKRDGC